MAGGSARTSPGGLLRSARRAPFFLAALGALILASCAGPRLPDGLYAKLDTARGTIIISLDYRQVPMTVTNFVGLAQGTISSTRGDKPFYNGLTFHRVVPGFVIQTGDPTATGSGGPGYTFPNEIVPSLRYDAPGIVGMANRGPNTNGSQFYITMEPAPWLNGQYTIFGHVVSGMKVVKAIRQGDALKRVTIIRVGSAAEAFKADQASFERLRSAAIERLHATAASKLAGDLAIIKSKWPTAIETKDGIRYIVEHRGSGAATPREGSEVTISYTGRLLNGTEFDSSAKDGKPLTFRLGETIQGLNQMLLAMHQGEERLIIVPPDLAYGDQGVPGRVPPDSYLVLNVTLVSFK